MRSFSLLSPFSTDDWGRGGVTCSSAHLPPPGGRRPGGTCSERRTEEATKKKVKSEVKIPSAREAPFPHSSGFVPFPDEDSRPTHGRSAAPPPPWHTPMAAAALWTLPRWGRGGRHPRDSSATPQETQRDRRKNTTHALCTRPTIRNSALAAALAKTFWSFQHSHRSPLPQPIFCPPWLRYS